MSAAPTCSTARGGRRRPPLLQWTYDQRTRSKIIATALLGALVALGVAAVGMTSSARAAQEVQHIAEVDLVRIGATADMRALLGGARVATRDSGIAADPLEAQAALDRVLALQQQFEAAAAAYTASPPSAEQRAALDDAVAGFDAYVGLVEATLGPLALADDAAAWATANTEQVAHLTGGTQGAVDGLRERVPADGEALATSCSRSSGPRSSSSPPWWSSARGWPSPPRWRSPAASRAACATCGTSPWRSRTAT